MVVVLPPVVLVPVVVVFVPVVVVLVAVVDVAVTVELLELLVTVDGPATVPPSVVPLDVVDELVLLALAVIVLVPPGDAGSSELEHAIATKVSAPAAARAL